jgi:serine/threonine protein kinase
LHSTIFETDVRVFIFPKPANVLLHGNIRTGDFVAKVTDFGVATNQQSHASNRTAETGTYRWMAPEVIRHESYSETADVYSFAIVLWQLITREDPFYDKSPIEAAGKVALELARPAFPEGVPAAVAGLIERCWDEDPNYRWSFDEVSKLLAALQLSDDEREWMQTPSGHQIYEVVDEVPQRLPPGPRRIQSERILDKVHPQPEKKGLRKFFSKK